MPQTSSSSIDAPHSIPIAIVGMSGFFPQAGDLRRYWQNILNRVDAIREVPAERWREEDFFDSDRLTPDKVYSKWGGFLDPVRFDPMKWKIPPASIPSIDPIQLLSLEVADRAFADAGYDVRSFPKERTGVIFACAGMNDVGSDYAFRTMISHHLPRMQGIPDEIKEQLIDQTHALLPEWTEDSFPGILTNVIAGRIANRFDLGGPNYTVDAACAASLAALFSAVAQLRTGVVDMMLVGAADGSNNAFTYMCFAKTHALSPRGKSRPFEDSADGIALGEGIAAILIKRLDDAVRDGDKIYAVIRGMGSSSDGRNRSMTAPHPGGQILALKRAYDDAGLPCATISLIEAHGTGTAVGDGTEITSLNTLYSEECTDKQFAAVGSVKSMIGHTKTCAGLASLVKTALALKHKVLPPTLHVEFPNRKVDFQNSAFFVNTESRPWFEELGDHPRRAGISAFGFGGTNFHVVLEEAPQAADTAELMNDLSPRPAEVFFWKRATKAALAADLQSLASRIESILVTDFAQLAYSVRFDEQDQAGECRLSIVAANSDELVAKLKKSVQLLAERDEIQDPTGIFYSAKSPVPSDSVAFLYPGQGSQALNMLKDLAVISRWSHPLFAHANQHLRDFFSKSLTRSIFPPPAFSTEDLEKERVELNATQVAQPALGLIEVFGTELLKRFGIQPGVTAGHSFGEYVALYAAGCLSCDDLLTLSAHRGRISAEAGQASSPGAMAAVNASAAQIQQLIQETGLAIELANLNAPEQTIVAGPAEQIEKAIEAFTQRGHRAKRLAVSGAFHTSLMASAAEQLGEILSGTKFQKANRPVYSNTLAGLYPDKPSEIRKLLQRHITEPVQFERQIRQMADDGVHVFVEVGPGRVLSSLVQRILGQDATVCLTLDASGRDGVTQFAHMLGQMFALGLPVELDHWFVGRGLKLQGTEEFWKTVLENSRPRRTDWILTTHSATPITPLPVRTDSREGLRAKFGKKTTGGESGAGANSGKPAAKLPLPATPNVVSAAREPKLNGSDSKSVLPTLELNGKHVSPEVTVNSPLNPSSAVLHQPSGALPLAPSMPLLSFTADSSRPPGTPFSTRSAANMNSSLPTNSAEPMNAGTAQLLIQSQTLMMQMLDLQKWQQQVALKFVEAHQQLIQSCTNGVAFPAIPVEMMVPAVAQVAPAAQSASVVPQVAPAPVVHAAPVLRPAAAPAAVRAPVAVNRVASAPQAPVKPTAVERKPAAPASHQGNGAAPTAETPKAAPAHLNGNGSENGHHGSNGSVAAKPAAAPETNGASNLHSVDEFRAALLKAVSERTGYPEDMLDETLPLESGLGIDSIKTVEIFSSLKEYHSFFQREGQDDEDALKEFTQLKTLGDIISMYELQHQAMSAGGAGSGSAADEKQVERYAVEAAEAPGVNGEKKNSRRAT